MQAVTARPMAMDGKSCRANPGARRAAPVCRRRTRAGGPREPDQRERGVPADVERPPGMNWPR